MTLIGLSLVKVGIMDMAGGQWLLDNKPDLFGSAQNLFLAFLVMIIVIVLIPAGLFGKVLKETKKSM